MWQSLVSAANAEQLNMNWPLESLEIADDLGHLVTVAAVLCSLSLILEKSSKIICCWDNTLSANEELGAKPPKY